MTIKHDNIIYMPTISALGGIETYVYELVKKIDANADKIQRNERKIHQNTGALEILQTFKADSRKFFIMWLITFIAFVGLLGYTIYILNDSQKITTTQKVEDVDSVGGDIVNGDEYGKNNTDNN